MITKIAEDRQLGHRLVRGHPVLEAEVIYTMHHEYCETIVDFIGRRCNLAIVDVLAAEQSIERVFTYNI